VVGAGPDKGGAAEPDDSHKKKGRS
jgi:hypothetical protein